MTVPFVVFRSAKGRPFAERKATISSRTLLSPDNSWLLMEHWQTACS